VLFQQLHITDDHAAVRCFTHVVNGQQGDLHGGEGFHLHAGLADVFGGGGADHLTGLGQHFELDRDARERDRVAQGDQVAGLFGAHDARQARDAQHIALFGGARLDQGQGGRLHADAAGGHRRAVGAGLAADVNHVGLPLGIEVGKGGGVRAHAAAAKIIC